MVFNQSSSILLHQFHCTNYTFNFLCQQPPHGNHMSWIVESGFIGGEFIAGAKVRAVCDDGYSSSNDDPVVSACGYNGLWSNFDFECKKSKQLFHL